jgi:glycosyltransferase involved in cell wall biosynthesis
MKLVVQIPCHNEAVNLPSTLADIPRRIEGISEVEILVIDDGSEDNTTEVALTHGADAVLRFRRRQGLARVFKAGIDAALRAGADIIVNTDGDNQYDGAEIPRLVQPLLDGYADMAVGDRNPGALQHFSLLKRWLQRFGSWTMRRLSGTEVADSTSGFRAYSREAALRINVISDFTYTLETLIQAGKRRLRIADVPIRARHTPRRSRLAPTMAHYLGNAGGAMARAYAMYQPMKVFFVIGGLFLAAGFGIGLRFLWLWMGGRGLGNVQSLILAAILSIVGFQTLSLGLLADLLGANRKLMEEVLYRVRRNDTEAGRRPALRELPEMILPGGVPPVRPVAVEPDRES